MKKPYSSDPIVNEAITYILDDLFSDVVDELRKSARGELRLKDTIGRLHFVFENYSDQIPSRRFNGTGQLIDQEKVEEYVLQQLSSQSLSEFLFYKQNPTSAYFGPEKYKQDTRNFRLIEDDPE